MRWVTVLLLRLRAVFFGRDVERELDEELRYHLERQIEGYTAAGMDSENARLAARRSLRDIEQRKEECRDVRRVGWLQDLAADLRYAVRSWRHVPAFAATAVVTLALGIGANTAVFSLLDALLLRPLPVADPNRLIRIGSLENNGMTMALPGPALDVLRRDPLLQGVCGVQTPVSNAAWGKMDAPIPVSAHAITGDCYRTLQVHPALGRLLKPSDDVPNGTHVVVISYSFWHESFAADPRVLGKYIRIEGVPFTVVGVTEKGFHGLLLGFPPKISFPLSQLQLTGVEKPGTPHFYWAHVLARMKRGTTREQVQAELATSWRRLLDRSFPQSRFKGAQRNELISQPVVVTSGANGLDYALRDRFRRPLAGLLAISALVLLVACTNLANLLLARGLERRHEMGVRLALGAGRGRIARQLISESALLMAAGLFCALALSSIGDRLLIAMLSAFYEGLWIDAGLSVRVLLFTASSAFVAMLLFGLLPALQTSDVNPAVSLKSASRSVSAGRARTRKVLISAQVTLTLVLVTGGVIFVETLQQLRDEPMGFATNTILNAQLVPLPGRALHKEAAVAYFTGLIDRIRNLGGVEDASIASFGPLLTMPYKEDVRRLDQPDKAILQAPAEFVSDGFLRTMRISLLQGSHFRRTGVLNSQKTAIVSRPLAKRLFPDGKALGRHIRFGSEPETRDLEIIGIAADARLEDPQGKDLNFLYLNLWQLPFRGNWGNLQLRYSGPAAPLIAALKAELRKGGRQYTLAVRSLDEQHELSLLQEKLLAVLGATFSFLALALAAVGLFGLLSFFVTVRTGEIGLRMALGAGRPSICWMVLREACMLVGIGILIGLPFCYFGGQLLSKFVYGISENSAFPLCLSAAILLVVAAAAALIPVYRAGTVDPIVALRYE